MKKYTDTGKKDTRSGFGAGLLIAGKADERIVALTADLKGSLKMDAFAKEFPERFFQCGIAEANMVGAAAQYEGPVYLRFGRPAVPNFTPEDEPFVIGKAIVLNEGSDVTLIACGHTVWESLLAAEALEAEGIKAEVINMATIKPLDEEALIKSARKTGAVVVSEEHNLSGGLGEAVAAVLARECPTPMVFVNGQDKFGQSGTPSALMAAYGLDAPHIAEAAKKAIAKK